MHLSMNGAGDWDLERRAAEAVAAQAPKAGVQHISLISGASACEENAWFPMTRAKLAAEQAIRGCGVSFSVFRCTMFMEMLPRFVRDGKAMVMGRQPNPWAWVAAKDYAAMVARAVQLPEAGGKIFHVRGPEPLTMEQALVLYCRLCAPQATVTHVPFWVLQVLALKSPQLRREGLPLMRYFSKTKEVGDPAETNALLGARTTTVERWCQERGPVRPS